MKGAYEKYSNKGLEIIGLGFQDSLKNIRKFAEENTIPWPVGFDKGDEIADLYGITFGAGVVFIDRNGIVKRIFATGFDEGDFNEQLNAIL